MRGAERQLAAQFAQVNVARADLYPTFRLAGSIGLESLSLANLLLPGASFWSLGPSVNTRLFNRRQLRENLVVQNERQAQAALTYESRVLGALQDVEDSLTALAQEQVRRDHLTAAAGAAEQAADLSLQLYTAGLRDFRDVLDSQRSLLTLQDSLASSGAAGRRSISCGSTRRSAAAGAPRRCCRRRWPKRYLNRKVSIRGPRPPGLRPVRLVQCRLGVDSAGRVFRPTTHQR